MIFFFFHILTFSDERKVAADALSKARLTLSGLPFLSHGSESSNWPCYQHTMTLLESVTPTSDCERIWQLSRFHIHLHQLRSSCLLIWEFQNDVIHPRMLSVHPSIHWDHTLRRALLLCLSSLLGYWTQSWTGRHSDTVYQQAGSHFADLGRMTGRVNPTCY